jgi:MMP 1-O-methyltransferase
MDIRKHIRSLIPPKPRELGHYTTIEGWLKESEANGLCEVAALLPKHSQVVEIGSWKGKSTWCIAQGLKKGIINCIDPFNGDGEEGSKEIYLKTKGTKTLLEQFQTNLQHVHNRVKVNILQGYSREFVGHVRNIDFLFIDGDHSIEGCRFDFENFEMDIKRGGYLAFHDYDSNRPDLGPTWVIDNLVKKNSSYRLFKTLDSLTIFKKNDT